MSNNLREAVNELQAVMAYAAELELEVDRLRRKEQFLQHEARAFVHQAAQLGSHPTDSAAEDTRTVATLVESCHRFEELLRDLRDLPGYHPAFDQVIAIAVRPLVDNAFRYQQRLSNVPQAKLRMDLQSEHIVWFPARLRHILDNLISNALRFRDPAKGEVLVDFSLRETREAYELSLIDNGLGMPGRRAESLAELFHRAAPTRAAGLGVGLAVVRLLIEQCCGSVSVASHEGQGTQVTVVLPRYDMGDFLP